SNRSPPGSGRPRAPATGTSPTAPTCSAPSWTVGSRTTRSSSASASSPAATQLRVAYVERLIREDGVAAPEARSRAALAYAAYLGYASLASAVPALVPHRPADRRRLQESLLDLALPAERHQVTRG